MLPDSGRSSSRWLKALIVESSAPTSVLLVVLTATTYGPSSAALPLRNQPGQLATRGGCSLDWETNRRDTELRQSGLRRPGSEASSVLHHHLPSARLAPRLPNRYSAPASAGRRSRTFHYRRHP